VTPLNCKTQEIKITTTNEEMIKREIANSMYDCWSMLGEGKLDFFGNDVWGTAGAGKSKSACVICSTIEFDDQLLQHPKELELLKYFQETKISDKNITYLEYFSDQNGAKLTTIPPKADLLKTNQTYAVIFMGIHGGSFRDALVRVIGVAAGGAVIGGGLGGPTGAGWGLLLGTVGESVMQIFNQIGSSNAAALYCDGDKGGCMAMSIVPMNTNDISKSCQEILSIT
jgi:hypothetical protein